MSVLRSLEREKDISFDLVVKAIEDALLIAYFRTEGAAPKARAELDRSSGHVTIWAAELDDEGEVVREFDDTPGNFSRIAATTAKQVILQQLRDAEDEINFGEFASREGELVSGVIQQGKDPRVVLVDLGKIEAVLPHAEQVPGEEYTHGERIRAYVVQVKKGHKGPSVTLSRTHPGLVKKLFALEVPEIADGTVEIAAVARGKPPDEDRGQVAQARRQRQGRLHRADGLAGPQRDDRVARREDRHHRLVGGSRRVRGECPVARTCFACRGSRSRRTRRAGDRARLPALAGHRQRGAERPARRATDGMADRHPARHPSRGRRRFRRCVNTVSWNMVATRSHSAPVWAAGFARLSPSCSDWCGSRIKWSPTCEDGFQVAVHRCIRP